MGLVDQLRFLSRPTRAPGWKALTDLEPSLSPEQIGRFERDGFLVLEGLFTTEEVSAARQRLFDLIYGRTPVPRGVKFEREVAVLDNDGPSYRQLWDIVPADPVLSEVISLNPKVVAPLKSLLGEDIKLYRATAMLKQARIGSDLPYHQDSSYWPITPMELVSCWVALDDATVENGCMRVLPAQHRRGLIDYDVSELDGVTYRKMSLDAEVLSREVCLEMKAGSCLLFHSLLPHATGPNHSEKNRFAVISSFMRSDSRPQPGAPPSDYLTVCGRSYRGGV